MLQVKDKIKAQTEKKAGRVARARVRKSKKSGSDVITSLRDAITADDVHAVLKVWREAMTATTERWDGETEKWVVLPDTRSRIEATKLVAGYKDGLPRQVQVVFNTNFQDLSAAMKKCQDSPEAMRLLQSMGGELTGVQETGSEKQAVVTREA